SQKRFRSVEMKAVLYQSARPFAIILRDMKKIVFCAALGLAATSAPTGLPSFGEPGISPDGTTIAFVSGGDIWEVPARGGDARLLVSHPATESRPIFAPDRPRRARDSPPT